MNGQTSEKLQTRKPIVVKTERIVRTLKELPNGWGGEQTKRPTQKAVRKAKKVLSALELGHMPWPGITAIPNGGIILTWLSICRDIMMTIDVDGDIQFVTSLKQIDKDTAEVVARLDSEGHVNDMLTIDQMMAWYSIDKSHEA